MNNALLEDIETHLLSVRDFIRWGATSFQQHRLVYAHGCDNAWDEALQLTFHCLHLPLDSPVSVLDARLLPEEKEAIFELLQRRIHQRIPVSYLTNQAWFGGLEFFVDERVLVPRSPIAELIADHFQPWVDGEKVNYILDLCTGSACIAIACAHYFPEAEVDAVDLSQQALDVAAINVSKHHLEDRVHLKQGNLFTPLAGQRYDIIVTNPPYVDAEDMQNLSPEFEHEPTLGLEAGEDGLDLAIPILQQAKNYLSPHGILIMEVGNSAIALQEQFPEVPFLWLSFERGGDGVLLLTAQDLEACF